MSETPELQSSQPAADSQSSTQPLDSARLHETAAGDPNSTRPPAPVGTVLATIDPNATRSFNTPQPRVPIAAPTDWPKIEGFEILGELGQGGMGIVYKARQTNLNRIVALKKLLPGMNLGWEELNRFRGEAEAVAQLQHPNIVQIFEIGQSDGLPFFSLEFVEGGSLDKRFAATPQPPLEAARLVAVLARAVHFANQKGIIHRDLKPANVLVALDGTLKVTDFGLAKRLDDDSSQTRSGVVMGTPSYMAPEQALGNSKAIGPAADIYALGAVLYAALTGRPPFRGTTSLETLDQVRSQEPVPPRRLQPKVPRDLETICLKCLRKDPVRRFGTAQELAEDLERFIDGRPVVARPIPAWERTYRWARRRPAQAAAVAALVVAAVGGTTAAVFYGLYEDQQAVAVQKQLDSRQRIDGLWIQGQQAETSGNLTAAKECWDKSLAELDADRTAAPDGLRRQIEQHQQRVAGQLLQQANRQKLAESLVQFDKHRDEVLFRAVNLRQQEGAANNEQIRQEGPAALRPFGFSGDEPPATLISNLDAYRATLPAEQFSQLAKDCFQVLVVWADAEAAAPSDQTQRSKVQAERAIRLLDAAAAVAKQNDFPTAQIFHARLAKYLDAAGDAARAVDERRLAGQQAPRTALDHFLTALDAYRRQQLPQAMAECDATLSAEPENFWARYLQGLCLLKDKQWASAKIAMAACLGQRPEFFWARLLRGSAEGLLGSPSGQPASTAEQHEEIAAAEDDFAQVLRQSADPFVRWSVFTTRGAMRIRVRQWTDAVADLQAAIKEQPDAPEGYVNLSLAWQGLKRWDDAVAALDEAIKRHPDEASLFHDRARLNKSRGNLAAARGDFQKAIACEPPGSTSERLASDFVELGMLENQAHEYRAALASFDRALTIRGNYSPALRERAESLIKLGEYAAAGKTLDEDLALGHIAPDVYLARGLIHTELHEYQQAVEAYSRSLMLESNKDAYDHRGWAYLSLEALRPALADFDAALKIAPACLDAYCGRGYVRVRLGQTQAAIADAEQALALKPVEPKQRFVLACVYARAAANLEAPPHKPNSLSDFARYRSRAAEQLLTALNLLPENRRQEFWRANVATARELDSILRDPQLSELAKKYAGAATGGGVSKL